MSAGSKRISAFLKLAEEELLAASFSAHCWQKYDA
jgi:hypothetical protein